ncbi:MAG: AAA family ATPase [Nitrososphaerota archaeon]|jgi:dephospho-CoA kinase|nr:AAA family ATPase [Nitrososphaerota archaeon]
MPGAGKTTAYGHLGSLGFVPVSMGDVVREEARRRGYSLDAAGQRTVQKLLRDEGGPAAIAELCARQIRERNLRLVVVDGVRSLNEISRFVQVGNVKILCVHASPSRRFEYLRKRGRNDDPVSREEFDTRDATELKLGVGEVIAMADRMVENENLTIEELQSAVERIARSWIEG